MMQHEKGTCHSEGGRKVCNVDVVMLGQRDTSLAATLHHTSRFCLGAWLGIGVSTDYIVSVHQTSSKTCAQ